MSCYGAKCKKKPVATVNHFGVFVFRYEWSKYAQFKYTHASETRNDINKPLKIQRSIDAVNPHSRYFLAHLM